MKKSKSLLVLFLAFAIVTLSFGITTTVMAVNSANDYKEASSTQLFVQNRAERKEKANKDMTKYFAVSLLMFLAFAVSVVLVVLQIVPKSEKKQE